MCFNFIDTMEEAEEILEIEEMLAGRSYTDKQIFMWASYCKRNYYDDGIYVDLTCLLPAIWAKKAREIRKNNTKKFFLPGIEESTNNEC